MRLYAIQSDGQPDYVEAESFDEAVDKWRAFIIGGPDRVSDHIDPDSVALVVDSDEYFVSRDFAVIR